MPRPGDPNEDADDDELPIVDIADDDFVIRKVPAVPHIQLQADGTRRISKSAFSPSSVAVDPLQGMSTNSEQLLVADGIELDAFAPEFPALAKLSVKSLRDMGLTVVHAPKKDDTSHCQVLGVRPNMRKKLLSSAAIIRKPDDVV